MLRCACPMCCPAPPDTVLCRQELGMFLTETYYACAQVTQLWCAEPCGECLLPVKHQSAHCGVNEPCQRRQPLLQISSPQQAICDSYTGILYHVCCHDHCTEVGALAKHISFICLPQVIQISSVGATLVFISWVWSGYGGHQACHQEAAAAKNFSCLKCCGFSVALMLPTHYAGDWTSSGPMHHTHNVGVCHIFCAL